MVSSGSGSSCAGVPLLLQGNLKVGGLPGRQMKRGVSCRMKSGSRGYREACTPPWIEMTFHLDFPKDGKDFGINARAISHGLEDMRNNRCDMDRAVMGMTGKEVQEVSVRSPAVVPGKAGGVPGAVPGAVLWGRQNLTSAAGGQAVPKEFEVSVGGGRTGEPPKQQVVGPGSSRNAAAPPDSVFLVRLPPSDLGRPVILCPPSSPTPLGPPPAQPPSPFPSVLVQPRPPARPQPALPNFLRPYYQQITKVKPTVYGWKPIAALIANEDTMAPEDTDEREGFEMQQPLENMENWVKLQMPPQSPCYFLTMEAKNTSNLECFPTPQEEQ